MKSKRFVGRNWSRLACATIALVAMAASAFAQPGSTKEEVQLLIESVRPKINGAAAHAARVEPVRYTTTDGGALRSISAPPGMHFPAPAGPPEKAARDFVRQHAGALGITSQSVDFQLKKKNSGQGRHSVRLTQTYGSVPVFGGEMVVQLNDAGGVEFVSGTFDRDMAALDRSEVALAPTVSTARAAEIARARYLPRAGGQSLNITPPELNLFVPAVLRLSGPKRLTWKLEVRTTDEEAVAEQVFIDANSGEIVQSFSLRHDLLDRRIHDSTNTTTFPGFLRRSEGQPATGINDVDLAYRYAKDYYDFFQQNFGRDSYDNAGSPIYVHVRYGYLTNPPVANGGGGRTLLSQGYATDDILGHEVAHSFTEVESGLMSIPESASINESMSDIFGEFVDLVNNHGNDDATNRWWVGEEGPNGRPDARPMHFPNLKGMPDWIGSPNYLPPGTNGEVHAHQNMGVNNKLCYLLTDGDTFRGRTIVGTGLTNVAALYYEANVNLLLSTSGWADLAEALWQAAINLGWSASQRDNLKLAMDAVGIYLQPIFLSESAGTCPETGEMECDVKSGPAKSLAKAFSLMATSVRSHLSVAGSIHTNRIERPLYIQRPLRIEAWGTGVRIEP